MRNTTPRTAPKRPCTICHELFRPEAGAYARYEEEGSSRNTGGGELCARCVGDLPGFVLVNGELWMLVLRCI